MNGLALIQDEARRVTASPYDGVSREWAHQLKFMMASTSFAILMKWKCVRIHPSYSISPSSKKAEP